MSILAHMLRMLELGVHQVLKIIMFVCVCVCWEEVGVIIIINLLIDFVRLH